LKIQADFVMEYLTGTTAVSSETCVGSQMIIDAVNNYLTRTVPRHAMPNGSHVSVIANAIKGTAKFVGDNPWIIPAIGALL
jgi:ElaB/YqjD/DUF883 family membrane-anchored ribosome-binding protein